MYACVYLEIVVLHIAALLLPVIAFLNSEMQQSIFRVDHTCVDKFLIRPTYLTPPVHACLPEIVFRLGAV